MKTPVSDERFAEVYNDITGYPALADVAVELGLSFQTVRNRATVLRRLREKGLSTVDLISRRQAYLDSVQKPAETETLSPRDHAAARARSLSSEITALLQRSRYPVVNPEAVIVDSYVTNRYSRAVGGYEEAESTPRTWLSDTLRVEPVPEPAGRRFIFTGAQNDAPLHREFWANLKAYAAYLDADIVVGPWTYETQWWSENNPTSRVYADELADYLCFGQMEIGSGFIFAGEMNTLPTAAAPITDLTTYSRGRWAVFPHAKLQLKSVPSTDPKVQAHQVMTTGAVTRPKVIPRKAGVKSIFAHTVGATLVEFDADGDVFCRQLIADHDGSFYDLDRLVIDGEVREGRSAIAITFADVHVAKLDARNADASFHAPDSLLNLLAPQYAFLHDVHDNESRNHHHVGDNAYAFEMAIRGRDSVFDEVVKGANFLASLRRPWCQTVVVESNHDIALERYVREGRYRNDGINVRYGLQLEDRYLGWREEVARALDAGREPPAFSLLEYAMRSAVSPGTLAHVGWVHDGQSFVVAGVECGHHGFRGANGAKGTVSGFARFGRKMSIGDKHSPEIQDGVYVAGAINLHMGYNKGPSGWAVSHIVQYPNGKRTLITLQNGKWRA